MLLVQNITDLLMQGLAKQGYSVPNIEVIPTNNFEFGHFATPVAFLIGKELKQNPREVASTIVETVNQIIVSEKIDWISEVTVAGNGFINLRLSDAVLVLQLAEITEPIFGDSSQLADKKIIVEYTDTNPFKEFHIGHLVGNIIGESLSRLFAVGGATVKKANYQGDIGLQIAKPVWGLQKYLRDEGITLADLEDKSLSEKVNLLGKVYAAGSQAYETDEAVKLEIQNINKSIFEQSDPEIVELYNTGRQWSLDHLEAIYKTLGTTFDYYFFESEIADRGKQLVQSHIGDVFVESEGAVVFPGENYGLHRRVFINFMGLPTYEAKELALAQTKYDLFTYDLSYIVTAYETSEYFKVVKTALAQLSPSLAEKTTHVSHGLLTLGTGKMSSRTGNVVTGESLLMDVIAAALAKVTGSSKEISPNAIPSVSEKIGVAAVKFAILRRNVGKDIQFDLDEALSFEGDSGPYLQYTYARAQSVLRKSNVSSETHEEALSDEEKELILLLMRFPYILADSQRELSPHIVCAYLIELARMFNSFYAHNPIIGSPQQTFRLQLTNAVSLVLKKGLYVLGIETVESM